MAGPRARYQGSAKDLAALLQPLVQPLGRSWLKYCEVDHAQAAKVEVENITASHSLLAVLHSQQANLSYPRKLVEQVVRLVYDQNSSEVAWSCRSEDLEPYIATMTARVVNLCRAVGQSERKHPKCSWVKALPWHQDTTKGSEGAVAASSVDDPTTYIYGWDTSLCMAWRCPRTVQGKSSRQKCLATAIKIPETATGSDPPIAYFPDGTTWEISDITCDEYASLCPSTRSKSDSLWQGTHCVSQHSLKICPKSDRTPLYVLCEQRRQVLQIQLRKCSSPETALQIIQKVAESFASNSIQREDLITERDRLMTEMGMTVPAKTIKKPAVKGQIKKTPAANQEPEKMQPSTEELQAMDGNEWFHLPSPPSSDDDWYKELA